MVFLVGLGCALPLFDGNAPLATLRLDLFDLFSCKHIVSLC